MGTGQRISLALNKSLFCCLHGGKLPEDLVGASQLHDNLYGAGHCCKDDLTL